MSEISIKTADGTCPAYTFEPAGSGTHPAVIVFMDGVGMRPALHPLAQRIADQGYFVLMPDLFYRAGAYAAPDLNELFTNPAAGKAWFGKIAAIARPEMIMRDMQAFLAYVDAQPTVRHGKLGVTGYCMGGRLAFLAAATYPERIAAVGSFHPGGLVSDDPASPHLLAPKLAARVYVAAATADASFTPAQQQTLADALAAAHVPHTVIAYPAKHGFVPTDSPVHDAAQAERHFAALTELFGATLA